MSSGVGKTTLIKQVCQVVGEQVGNIRGFYTEELQEQQGKRKGPRIGFDVVTLDGRRGPLARVAGRYVSLFHGENSLFVENGFLFK